VSFDIPEWMLLEQVDDYEQFYIFLCSEKWKVVSTGNNYLEFVSKYPIRNIVVHFFLQSKGRLGWIGVVLRLHSNKYLTPSIHIDS